MMSLLCKLKPVLVIATLLFTNDISCFAQNADTTGKKHKKIKVLPVPSFGHSPETGTYVGAVALFTLDFYKDTLTRTSNAKLEFNYTWRKQIIIEGEWNYFTREENWYTQGLLQYSKYPDLYYGIGENTPKDAEIRYQTNRFVADFNVLKKIAKKTFLGPKFRYMDYRAMEYDTTERFYPELANAGTGGAGFTLLRDTRDNLLNAGKGAYMELTSTYNSGSGFNYTRLSTDVRGYKTVRPKLILSGRYLNEWTFGNPPFYDYSLLGGDNKVRGVYYGRYREKNLSTIQAEARWIVIWRLGVAVFGGASKLYPDVQSLSFNHIKLNYGAGLRFVIDRQQNINLRLDYALASGGQSGFYVSFGESF